MEEESFDFIYIVKENNVPNAYGSLYSLRMNTGSEFYDKKVSVTEWSENDSCCYIDENGMIILGDKDKDKKIIMARIEELKQMLADTDYAIVKIAEGSATKEEYAELIENRRLWRKEINELEEQLG